MKSVHLLPVLTAFLLLGACSSSPRELPSDAAGLDFLVFQEREIRSNFGRDLSVSPFVVPSGIMIPKTNEFIVIGVMANLPKRQSIEVYSARAFDEKGQVVAQYFARERLIDFWDTWNSDPTVQSEMTNAMTRFCLPEGTSELPKGRSKRALVLIGKRPLAYPLTIEIDYRLQDSMPKLVTIALP